ncbi:MAG: chromate efflux transporter, partial [Gammaproteobacteria bacterium]
MANNPTVVSYSEALRVWIRIALLSFGGPAAQIAVMHRILVDEKRWISESRFLHALNYCMLLPGPEAMQLATYVGWLLHGTRGGLTAGLLFILPGFVAILVLSLLYAVYGQLALVEALFFGLKAAVLAIVLQALLSLGKKTLAGWPERLIALAAFIAIFFFVVPFPLIILTAAVLGWLGLRQRVRREQADATASRGDAYPPTLTVKPTPLRAIRLISVFALLWFGPLLWIAAQLGTDSVYFQEGWFFSKAAVVTFGGAYAVLAYIAQQAVDVYGWLAPGEMLDGLGMAETTPGPLIQVVQFVGFMGAYRLPGELNPLVAGTFGAILTTWVTFVPCFLWIFLGAPYVEALRGNQALSAALRGITAAVVGVILNLALWFALHVLFADLDETWFG